MKNNILEKPFTPKDPAKYELARRLYFDCVPLKEIAERVEVSAQTLTSWKQKGSWEERRNAQLLSPKTLYNKLLKQLDELIEQGEPDRTADAISKICKQIKELQKDSTIDDIINVLTEQSKWIVDNGKLFNVTNEFLQQMTILQDAYVHYLIEKATLLD